MNFEATLVQTALAGTRKPHALAPGDDSAMGRLCDQISQESAAPALKILRLAAALWLGARCGFVATQMPMRTRARASAQKAAAHSPIFITIFNKGPFGLQAELLDHLLASGLRLPSQSLIAALTMGLKSSEIRERLIPALGARGRWLASQNKVWSYAANISETGDVTDTWSHGTLTERVSWLKDERQRDPAAARELLAHALSNLAPAERVELVRVLEVGLGQADEAFLNLCLKDRGQEVRLAAACLLFRLPESAFSVRMSARLNALIFPVGCGWSIHAPELKDVDDSWQADQIETVKSVYEQTGERAWLMAQLVSWIHPSWWVDRLRMTPEDLLQWAAKTRWKEALHQGWLDAVSKDPSVAWSTALMTHIDENRRRRYRQHLMSGRTVEQIEAVWKNLPENSKLLGLALQEILAGCPSGQKLSKPFSSRVVERLRVIIATKNPDFLNSEMPIIDLGAVLHLDALQTLCNQTTDHPFVSACLNLLLPVLELRKQLASYIQQNPVVA